MRKFAGVAVAAAMGACAFAGEASASPFTIAISAKTNDNGPLDATFTGDTESSYVSFQYSESEPSSDLSNTITTAFSGAGATLVRGASDKETGNPGVTSYSQTFTVKDANFPYTIHNTNGTNEQENGFSFSFMLFHAVYDNGYDFYYSSSISTVLASSYNVFNNETSVTGDPITIFPVHLPSSAPLFGAALLGLGAVGYGMKRRMLSA